jgi:hypothetical protein
MCGIDDVDDAVDDVVDDIVNNEARASRDIKEDFLCHCVVEKKIRQ